MFENKINSIASCIPHYWGQPIYISAWSLWPLVQLCKLHHNHSQQTEVLNMTLGQTQEWQNILHLFEISNISVLGEIKCHGEYENKNTWELSFSLGVTFDTLSKGISSFMGKCGRSSFKKCNCYSHLRKLLNHPNSFLWNLD